MHACSFQFPFPAPSLATVLLAGRVLKVGGSAAELSTVQIRWYLGYLTLVSPSSDGSAGEEG